MLSLIVPILEDTESLKKELCNAYNIGFEGESPFYVKNLSILTDKVLEQILTMAYNFGKRDLSNKKDPEPVLIGQDGTTEKCIKFLERKHKCQWCNKEIQLPIVHFFGATLNNESWVYCSNVCCEVHVDFID